MAWRPALVTGTAAVLLGLAVWPLWPEARGHALGMEHLARVRTWQTSRDPGTTIEAWLWTRRGLSRALEAAPHNADLHEAMAYLYLSEALKPDQVPMLQGTYLAQGVKHLTEATAARPMAPLAWANKALALHRLSLLEAPAPRADIPSLWDAFDRAMAYGQRDPAVQPVLASIAFERWPHMAPVRQQAIRDMYDRATAGQRRTLKAMAQPHDVVLGF